MMWCYTITIIWFKIFHKTPRSRPIDLQFLHWSLLHINIIGSLLAQCYRDYPYNTVPAGLPKIKNEINVVASLEMHIFLHTIL